MPLNLALAKQMRATFSFFLAILFVAAAVPWAIEREIVAYPPVFLVGTVTVVGLFSLLSVVPLFMWLREQGKAKFLNLSIAAFLSGYFSYILFGSAMKPTNSQVGTKVLVERGEFTAAGWADLLITGLWVGLAAIIGTVIWVVAMGRARNG